MADVKKKVRQEVPVIRTSFHLKSGELLQVDLEEFTRTPSGSVEWKGVKGEHVVQLVYLNMDAVAAVTAYSTKAVVFAEEEDQ